MTGRHIRIPVIDPEVRSLEYWDDVLSRLNSMSTAVRVALSRLRSGELLAEDELPQTYDDDA